MKKTELEKLNKAISAGRWPFVLKQGVIGWGVTTAVLFSLAMTILNGVFSFIYFAVSIIFFCIGGFFWGLFMWQFIVWRRNKLMRQQS